MSKFVTGEVATGKVVKTTDKIDYLAADEVEVIKVPIPEMLERDNTQEEDNDRDLDTQSKR